MAIVAVRHVLKRALTLLAVAGVVFASGAGAGDIQLPDMGSPADAVLSKNEEAQIGRQIMYSIWRSGKIVEDPQVTEYVNEIGHRLVAQTNDGDQDFHFFVINDQVINAFALPGGYIGVHTGLIEATHSEDELAGVLAHEIAHVTQRHIARAVHANSRQNILTTALMLGAMILGAAGGDSDVVGGALAVAQGTAAQQQINFTRANESEADRIGIGALAGAGFDPHGMASFFEVLARQTPGTPETRVPAFLQTHPVTTARIAEARARAREYPPEPRDDTQNYGITKARLTVADFDTAEQAVNYVEQRDYANQTDIEKYGRAVAYQRAGRNLEANRIFRDLVSHDKKVIAYHIGLGQTQIALEDYDAGVATLDHAIELFPRNVPLVTEYAELLLRLDRASQAHAMLLDLLNNVPPTPEQVRLIARAANEAGDIAESYYYLSEYSLMTGDLMGGIDMLQRALSLPQLQEIQRIRFEARIDFIRDFMTEEQLKQLQRSRPNGVTARLTGE